MIIDETDTLTDAERRVLLICFAASQLGTSPCFRADYEPELKPVADALVLRGLLYRLTGELEPGEDPESAGYHIVPHSAAERLAEKLADSSHWDFGSFL